MKKLLPIVLVSIFLFTACLSELFQEGRGRIESLPRDLTAAEKEVIQSDREFGVELFRELAGREEGNIFISPLSISMALGMTVNGAAGETRAEMKEALRKSGMSMEEINESYRGLLDILPDLDPGVKMRIANSIWYRQSAVSLRETFETDTRRYFDTQVEGLDFSDPTSVDIINGWADEQTEGLIPTIIDPPIPANVITYLMNAIYFKGAWFTPFNPDDTEPAPFTTASGEEVEVEMMDMEEEKIPYYSSGSVAVADLAYGDSLYSMTLIMPRISGRSLDSFIEEEFTKENLDRWIDGLSERHEIKMPKFEIEYEVDLNQVLQAMGMETAFSSNADFTNMYENGDGWIDKVKQKAHIKVDEKGTEAAAVTSVSILASGHPSFNRPFIYLIRERLSGTILFIGRMNDPTAG